jgi:glutamate-1-semialdehyde 2,1-aminomutase
VHAANTAAVPRVNQLRQTRRGSDDSAAMGHMQAMGRQLTEGLSKQAARHGVAVTISGPSAMPFMTFDADDEAAAVERPRGHLWCSVVAQGGESSCSWHRFADKQRAIVFVGLHSWMLMLQFATRNVGSWLHPHHNWYLTASHSSNDIEETLAASDAAFAAVVAQYNDQ